MSRTSVRSEQVRDKTILVDDLRDFCVEADTGLDVAVCPGRIRNDNTITDKTEQILTLVNGTTNYVEINTSGVAFSNTTGFTAGRIPLATVVTSGGAITTITDKRSWIVVDNNSGGGSTPPGTLSDTTKDVWIALAETKIVEDQTADRVANEVGSMRVDVFTDGSGIDSGLSADYTLRGTPNYDVVVTPTSLSLFRPGDISTNLQANYKLGAPSQYYNTLAGSGGLNTTTKKFGAGSYRNNDAGNNYLGWANRTDLSTAFGTNWTVEFWFNFDSAANNDIICVIGQVNPANDTNFQVSNYLTFNKGSSGQMTVQWSVNGVSQGSINHQTVMSAGTWYHCAFVKNGSVETLYIDGVASSSTLSSSATWTAASAIIFGTNNSSSGGDHFAGYVDEFRISTVARYTTGFTPPSSAFTSDADTRSLIHFDVSNFIDEGMPDYLEKDYSVNNNHLTNFNTVGTSNEDYWNTSELSGDFETSSNEYLAITDAAQTGLDITGSFTISAFVKLESSPPSTERYMIFKKGNLGGSSGYRMFIANSTRELQVGINGTDFASNSVLSVNKWHHVAVSYNGAYVMMFIDGNLDKAVAHTTNPTANSNDAVISAENTVANEDAFDGLIKDVAVWSSALSTLQIKSIALGTDLTQFSLRPDHSSISTPTHLWKLNEISADNQTGVTRTDVGSNVKNMSPNINGVSVRGGFIDSVGAFFQSANSNALISTSATDGNFGSGDFTLSSWLYFSTLSLEMPFFNFQPSGANNWVCSWQTSNQLRFKVISSSLTFLQLTWSFTPKTNTWYHWTLTRSGSTWTMYIDGQSIGTNSDSSTIPDFGSATFGVGFGFSSDAGGNRFLNGRMADAGVWTGTALSQAEISSIASGLPLQTQGIISYWKMNDGSGLTATDEIGVNNLTSNGTVGSGTGQVGNGRTFNGSTQYLSIADASQVGLDLIKDLTLMTWFKATSPGNQWMIDKDSSSNGYGLQINSTPVLQMNVKGLNTAGTTTISSGIFYHGVGVFTGAERKVYLNSANEGTTASTVAPIDQSNIFSVGAFGAGASNFFNGTLDEMLVAARWFRDEEIKTAYNKGLNAKEVTSSEITPSTTATVISTAFTVSTTPDRALLIVNEVLNAGAITYYVSRVSSPGTNLADTTKWTPITPGSITDISGQTSGTSCRWAAVIEDDAELDDVAVVFGTIGGSGGGSGSSADLGLLFSLMGA